MSANPEKRGYKAHHASHTRTSSATQPLSAATIGSVIRLCCMLDDVELPSLWERTWTGLDGWLEPDLVETCRARCAHMRHSCMKATKRPVALMATMIAWSVLDMARICAVVCVCVCGGSRMCWLSTYSMKAEQVQNIGPHARVCECCAHLLDCCPKHSSRVSDGFLTALVHPATQQRGFYDTAMLSAPRFGLAGQPLDSMPYTHVMDRQLSSFLEISDRSALAWCSTSDRL